MNTNISGILSVEQLDLLNKLASSLTNEQRVWVSGYLAGLSARNDGQVQSLGGNALAHNESALTILVGSRTGNGEGLAKFA